MLDSKSIGPFHLPGLRENRYTRGSAQTLPSMGETPSSVQHQPPILFWRKDAGLDGCLIVTISNSAPEEYVTVVFYGLNFPAEHVSTVILFASRLSPIIPVSHLAGLVVIPTRSFSIINVSGLPKYLFLMGTS